MFYSLLSVNDLDFSSFDLMVPFTPLIFDFLIFYFFTLQFFLLKKVKPPPRLVVAFMQLTMNELLINNKEKNSSFGYQIMRN
jgi:hypothetical protein